MKVLVSDDLSPQGVAILKEAKGIEVEVKTGLSPEELRGIIADYHGLVVRSATKVTAEIIEAAAALKERGARRIMACITHAVLADSVFDKLNNSDISALAVTNTVMHDPEFIASKTDRIQILSVARILGEAMHRIHHEESLSSLFI